MYTKLRNRIEAYDSLQDVLHKLSEGNPGALSVLMQSIGAGPDIDPDSALSNWSAMFALDDLGIYGPEIWLLYKDICKENLPAMYALFRARQLGYITRSEVLDALDEVKNSDEHSLDLVAIKQQVQERLPDFGDTDEYNL